MTIYEFIGSIDNKTYKKIRNSQSDAECRRYLKEHLRKQLNIPVLDEVWNDVNVIKPPEDIQIIVKLERETIGGFYQIAKFGRIPLVGSNFMWDMPKITHWAYIPNFS